MLGALEGIEEEASSKADSLLGVINGEAGDQTHRDREVLGGPALDFTRCLTLLDL